MNIGVFTDTYLPSHDGVVTSIVDFRRELEQRDHTFWVFAPYVPPRAEGDEVPNDPRLKQFYSMPWRGYDNYHWPLVPQSYYHIIEDNNLELLHSHGMAFMGWRGVWASIFLKLPLVFTWHTMVNDAMEHYINRRFAPGLWLMFKIYFSWYFRHCNIVITPSEATKRELLQIFEPRFMGDIHVVPNGIDVTRFHPGLDRTVVKKRLGLEENRIILHLGRIAREKNLDLLINALPIVKKKVPEAKLLVVGAGPAEEHYIEMVQAKRMTDTILFTGHIPEEEKPYYYAGADAFATPSTFETQGLVILEAMACGKPVAGCNYRAIPDIITDGVNGFLFDRDNHTHCARAIINALNAGPELKHRARETAQRYSLTNCADKLERIYEGVQGQAPCWR